MPRSFRSLSAALAAAAALSACATAPEPVAVARDEAGVIVAARPIVVAPVDAPATPTPATAPAAAAAVPATPQAQAALPPEPGVRIAVIADRVGAGETQLGVSYTIRRDRDGTLFEVGQAGTQALAPGTRVHIGYGQRVLITPAS